jgi:hypothetical protein
MESQMNAINIIVGKTVILREIVSPITDMETLVVRRISIRRYDSQGWNGTPLHLGHSISALSSINTDTSLCSVRIRWLRSSN